MALGCTHSVCTCAIAQIVMLHTKLRQKIAADTRLKQLAQQRHVIWRRGRDLNPGKACTFNSFQVRMVSGCGRPLTSTEDQKRPSDCRICP